ncbi:hypothetical protein PM10SUCC1_15070 [Propionigenium maris DSM 9537]|uniref:Outer membrane protein TolC n=1 Tax=Propionigenium maris DSM 9537 TaxID=1123000 RepID=A0A9W6GKH9_9FUSO|nr:TolC family protein [Propionigenium maris]GLI55993.1 hypothetical protein PM10SUCC1_15070 [Propionigenium maris DSM 9537]
MKKFTTICSLLLLSSTYASAQEISVGIIVPSEEDFQKELLESKEELREVLGDNYEIKPIIREYSNLEELEEAYRDLSRNNEVILSLDPVSSKYLKETGGDKVLTPFTEAGSVVLEGGKNFKKIYPFRTLTLLTTREVNSQAIVENLERDLNIDVTVSYIEEMSPLTTDAILLYNPSRRDEENVSTFIRDNLDQGRPTFAVMSRDYVEGGALAGIVSGESSSRLLRESVLELEQDLSGETYPVDEDYERKVRESQLLFNLSTSKRLGVYPSRDILDRVVFVGSYLQGSDDLNFQEAINIALDNNLTLRSQSYSLDAFSFNPKRARANNRPNVDAFGNYTNQNDVYTKYSPVEAENTLRGGVRVKQSIFNDDIWKEIEVQEKAYEAEKENYRRDESNTIFNAGARYLNVLSAQASLNIKNYNLDLTREFLEIAKNRKDVGISDASDVFRLESLYAQSLTEVRSDTGKLENSQRALNQTLNLPLESKFEYSPMNLENEAFLTSNEGFLDILENPVKLREFTEFFIGTTKESIPEIKSIDFLIAGKEREYKTAARRRYTPSMALEAQAAWDMADPWGENDEGKGKEDYWQLGVGFELPLYKGGDITYEKNQISSELKALESNKEAITEDFGRVIAGKITDLSVGYEAIQNAQRSTAASEKNLELVRDNYAKGTVSITNLLDAQNDAVNSREQEVIATYNFLITLLDLERTVGSYYFAQDNTFKASIDNKIHQINSRGGNINEN